jgi:hypothetical protein
MFKDEALKMAIELMERFLECDGISSSDYIDVMNACKEALEQPSQEPVAWIKNWADGSKEIVPDNYEGSYPVYTRPAQPLSDDEINELWKESCEDVRGLNLGFTTQQHYFAWLIEQAHGIGAKE